MGDELLLNFGAKFQRSFMFHMCNYKIAMATFHTSQCQMALGLKTNSDDTSAL